MKILQILTFAASASAAAIVFPRRIGGCKDDNCMNAVNKAGQGAVRLEDCSSFVENHKITSYVYLGFSKTNTIVVPTTVTTLVTKQVTVEIGSTTIITQTSVITQTSTITLPALIPRDDEVLEFERRQVTLPYGVPAWASGCKSKDGTEAAFRFSSACSCFFRTASLPPVTMETVTTTISLTSTFEATKVVTETEKTTTSVPVTTVVNVETQTEEELATVTATATATATASPPVEYYIKVKAAYAPDLVTNETYNGQYLARDTKESQPDAFTLTSNIAVAIKFQFRLGEEDTGFDDGYLSYQLDEETYQVTGAIEAELEKDQTERSALISASKPPLESGISEVEWWNDHETGILKPIPWEILPDVIYYDDDEGRYPDKAGRLWLQAPNSVVLGEGITLLELTFEEVLPGLPEPEEPEER